MPSEKIERLKAQIRFSSQLFILARDQAFFKVQFFSGDRAGDLGRVKTKEMLYFSGAKSMQDGTSNLSALKRLADSSVCSVTAVEVYISLYDHRHPKLTIREIDRINDLCKRMNDLCKRIEWDVTT